MLQIKNKNSYLYSLRCLKYSTLFLFLLFCIFPFSAKAISFSTNSYTFQQQRISIIDGLGGAFKIFNLSNSDVSSYSQESYVVGDQLHLNLPVGDYSAVETIDGNCFSYTLCTDPAEYINEFLFSVTLGLTLSKTVYYQDEPVVITSQGPIGGNPYQVYDFSSGAFVSGGSSYSMGDSFFMSPGNYSILEVSNYNCFYASYDECKASPDFLQEIPFTVLVNLISEGGGEELPTHSITEYQPQIEIKSPKAGIFSKKIPIIYSTIDYNDSEGGTSKERYGLINKPVSIFYTDQFMQNNVADDVLSKTLIAKDLLASSTYLWNPIGLLEKKFYQIVVRAIDLAGQIGQSVSEFFTVDLTPPTFIVTANPSVVKSENVTITVKPSEDLSGLPKVSVLQRGGTNLDVKVFKEGDIYKAIYKVVSGFDGTAKIQVTGTDMAGNEGSVITGGGIFSVGVNPPSKPVIISLTNNVKVTNEKIDISGTTREDTEVVATVNGLDAYKTKPNENGEFIIKNVLLKKDNTNGKNTINLVAVDSSGSTSEAVILDVLFNIPPSITIIEPKTNAILSGMTTVSTKATDENGDPIHFRYEMIPDTILKPVESDWQEIADVPNDQIYFDTTKFLDGNYLLRVIADDGATATNSSLLNIHIRNESSFFIRFYDGLHTVVNQKTATVRGMAYAQKNISPQPTIKSIEYSINSGKTWIKVSAEDGTLDSSEERFEVILKNLKDGVNNTMWRTTDSRGMIVKTEQPVIVDRIAPKQPEILFPKNGDILTKDNNENLNKGKFSFNLNGKAEPNTTVNVEVDGKKFSGRVSFDGTFRVVDIDLSKIGKYTIKVSAIDEALNQSPVLEYSFIYDNPPSAVFTNPSDGRGLAGDTVVSWITSDIDGEKILNDDLSYHQIGKPFISLGKNLKENKFSWNTVKLPEGNDYELRLTVKDGLASSVVRIPFSIDRTPPLLSFTFDKLNYKKGEVLNVKGTAEDSDSGVLFVEYNFTPIDTGDTKIVASSWYKAEINDNSFGKRVSFSIKNPITFGDGQYQVMIRSVDKALNVSLEKNEIITVDNTAPRVGSFEIYNGETKLLPKDNIWNVLSGSNLNIILSLEKDTKEASLLINKQKIILEKDLATGLWKGNFTLDNTGDNAVFIQAVDTSDNLVKDKVLVNLNVSQNTDVKKDLNTRKWWYSVLHMLQLI